MLERTSRNAGTIFLVAKDTAKTLSLGLVGAFPANGKVFL